MSEINIRKRYYEYSKLHRRNGKGTVPGVLLVLAVTAVLIVAALVAAEAITLRPVVIVPAIITIESNTLSSFFGICFDFTFSIKLSSFLSDIIELLFRVLPNLRLSPRNKSFHDDFNTPC